MPSAEVGRRRVFVDGQSIRSYQPGRIMLTSNEIHLKSFERREGEVLLRTDVLGHRLIEVAAAELVRASDVELQDISHGWVPVPLDARRRPKAAIVPWTQSEQSHWRMPPLTLLQPVRC